MMRKDGAGIEARNREECPVSRDEMTSDVSRASRLHDGDETMRAGRCRMISAPPDALVPRFA